MDDEWNALEHYLLARAMPPTPDLPVPEPPEVTVVLTIPTLEADDAAAPPVAALGARPTPA
jgi:hypothetical protein